MIAVLPTVKNAFACIPNTAKVIMVLLYDVIYAIFWVVAFAEVAEEASFWGYYSYWKGNNNYNSENRVWC